MSAQSSGDEQKPVSDRQQRRNKKDAKLPVNVPYIPIQQPIEFNLSAHATDNINQIIMNWGAVDFYVELALINAYGAITPDHAELLRGLGIDKKLNLLRKLCKAKRIPEIASDYIGELQFANTKFKEPRNIVAHGISVKFFGTDKIMQASGTSIDVFDLDLYVQQSRFALRVAQWLTQIIAGHQSPMPLPKRPPLTSGP